MATTGGPKGSGGSGGPRSSGRWTSPRGGSGGRRYNPYFDEEFGYLGGKYSERYSGRRGGNEPLLTSIFDRAFKLNFAQHVWQLLKEEGSVLAHAFGQRGHRAAYLRRLHRQQRGRTGTGMSLKSRIDLADTEGAGLRKIQLAQMAQILSGAALLTDDQLKHMFDRSWKDIIKGAWGDAVEIGTETGLKKNVIWFKKYLGQVNWKSVVRIGGLLYAAAIASAGEMEHDLAETTTTVTGLWTKGYRTVTGAVRGLMVQQNLTENEAAAMVSVFATNFPTAMGRTGKALTRNEKQLRSMGRTAGSLVKVFGFGVDEAAHLTVQFTKLGLGEKDIKKIEVGVFNVGRAFGVPVSAMRMLIQQLPELARGANVPVKNIETLGKGLAEVTGWYTAMGMPAEEAAQATEALVRSASRFPESLDVLSKISFLQGVMGRFVNPMDLQAMVRAGDVAKVAGKAFEGAAGAMQAWAGQTLGSDWIKAFLPDSAGFEKARAGFLNIFDPMKTMLEASGLFQKGQLDYMYQDMQKIATEAEAAALRLPTTDPQEAARAAKEAAKLAVMNYAQQKLGLRELTKGEQTFRQALKDARQDASGLAEQLRNIGRATSARIGTPGLHILSAIVRGLTHWLKEAGTFLDSHPFFASLASNLAIVLVGLAGFGALMKSAWIWKLSLEGLFDILALGINGLIGLGGLFATFFMSVPGLILLGVAAAAALTYYVYTHWDRLKKKIIDAKNWMIKNIPGASWLLSPSVGSRARSLSPDEVGRLAMVPPNQLPDLTVDQLKQVEEARVAAGIINVSNMDQPDFEKMISSLNRLQEVTELDSAQKAKLRQLITTLLITGGESDTSRILAAAGLGDL